MTSIPLFPLDLVIFPQGLLSLRIFEQRYVDMVRDCLRNNIDFGVVSAIKQANQKLPFLPFGCTVEIADADIPSPGLFTLKCEGLNKFKVNSAKQQADGLWLGEVEFYEREPKIKVPSDLLLAKNKFEQLIENVKRQGLSESDVPFMSPYQLDDCAWLANRWCEVLPIPLIEKQRLLALDSPLLRLELIHDILSDEDSAEAPL